MNRLPLFSLILFSLTKICVAAPLTYSDVAPILLGRCAMCHAPGGIMGDPPENFRLDSYAETISRGDRARVVPGNALASELYRRIMGYAMPRMPFNGPPFLSDEEANLVARWINDGARDVTGAPAQQATGARIRLHGRLSNHWELDGLALQAHSDTRFKKSPAIGDYVRVRGRIGVNGTVIADRIEVR